MTHTNNLSGISNIIKVTNHLPILVYSLGLLKYMKNSLMCVNKNVIWIPTVYKQMIPQLHILPNFWVNNTWMADSK